MRGFPGMHVNQNLVGGYDNIPETTMLREFSMLTETMTTTMYSTRRLNRRAWTVEQVASKLAVSAGK